ncbi:MAG: phosphoribosyltransferase family protein [Acidimicrobiales bacterium]
MIRSLAQTLLGASCAVCGAAGPSPCVACATRLRPAGPVRPCPTGLTSCTAVLRYEGAGRDLITALKYRNHHVALDRLAGAAAERASATVGPIDLVTWPPTTAGRRRQRGYDQAELVARAVAAHLGRPARATMRRRPGPPQTGRDAAARRGGPRFTAPRRPARHLTGARVLLVDDVVTTGATFTAAARLLRHLGAQEVHGLALARTPSPHAVAPADG